MKKLGVLYKATDPQGHCYIGQHVGDGSDIGKTYFGSGPKTYFTNTRTKHGNDYFTYWVFAKDLTQEERNEGEIYYIKFFQAREYQNGYNLTDGGDGGDTFSGRHHTDDTKKKQSGIYHRKSDEEKSKINSKISESQKIAQNKPETVRKRAKSMLGNTNSVGRKHPEEMKKKISESNKITKNNPKDKPFQIANGRHAAHIKNHFNKGILNLDCQHCIDQIMKEHS